MQDVDRRDFLRSAAAMAAASTASGAERRIRIGVFGTQHGHVRSKLRALRSSAEYEVVGVHEPEEAVRKQKEGEDLFQGLRWISEEELLGDDSLDVILVECRVWQAIPWGRKVLDAGKHLHLEKPPSPDMAPFRELVEEAKRKKLLLQLGYNYRFHPGIGQAIEAMRKGWLGDVYLMRATMNSDRSTEQRAIEARYPGGAFFELAGHMVDRAVELFGRPLKVQSWLRHDTSVEDDLADNTMAVLEYEKALAVISTAAKMPNSGSHRSFELIGTDGSFHIQPIAGPRTMRVNLRHARGPSREGWQEIELPAHIFDVQEFADLARAIRTGDPLKYSYDHELLVHETLLRASGHMT